MPMKIRWNPNGFYDIRRLPSVQGMEEGIADGVAARSNAQLGEPDGFRTSSRQGVRRPQGRWRTTVIAVTTRAKRHNAKHNTLLKNLKG